MRAKMAITTCKDEKREKKILFDNKEFLFFTLNHYAAEMPTRAQRLD
jgi:hypothetical protein